MIVFSFDVLARPAEAVVLRHPDPDGLLLWRHFYDASMGQMAIVFHEQYKQAHVEHWMLMNNVKANIYEFLHGQTLEERAREIQAMGFNYGAIQWYVDDSPAMVRAAIAQGIPSMLVALPYEVPSYAHPNSDWDSLVAEIERQKRLRTEREWDADRSFGG